MKTKSASESAFFNPRILLGFVLCSIAILLALVGLGLFSAGSLSAQAPNANQQSSGPTFGASYKNDISPPLRSMPRWKASDLKAEHEAKLQRDLAVYRQQKLNDRMKGPRKPGDGGDGSADDTGENPPVE